MAKFKPVFHLLTCPMTEPGFVRIFSQAPLYGFTVARYQLLLHELKQSTDYSFTFVPDNDDASQLTPWVTASKRTTDGHLQELTSAHDAQLATFDNKIPRAFLIS